MKTIKMVKSELHWTNYTVEWTEEDFLYTKEWLEKTYTISKYHMALRDLFKDVSWEDAVKDYKRYRETGHTGIYKEYETEDNKIVTLYLCYKLESFITEDAWDSNDVTEDETIDCNEEVEFLDKEN